VQAAVLKMVQFKSNLGRELNRQSSVCSYLL